MSSLFSVALRLCGMSSKKEFLCYFPLAADIHREQDSKPAAEPLNAKSAGRQNTEGPDQRRSDIGNLEVLLRHTTDTCDQRDDSTKRAKEAANKRARHAPFIKKSVTTYKHLRMTGERPEVADTILIMGTDPVRKPVAQERTGRRCRPDGPERDTGFANQRAKSEQNKGRGKQQRKKGQ